MHCHKPTDKKEEKRKKEEKDVMWRRKQFCIIMIPQPLTPVLESDGQIGRITTIICSQTSSNEHEPSVTPMSKGLFSLFRNYIKHTVAVITMQNLCAICVIVKGLMCGAKMYTHIGNLIASTALLNVKCGPTSRCVAQTHPETFLRRSALRAAPRNPQHNTPSRKCHGSPPKFNMHSGWYRDTSQNRLRSHE